MPPTSPNQKTLEDDLRRLAGLARRLPDATLQERCKQAAPGYDRCISCATHFLKLTVDRG